MYEWPVRRKHLHDFCKWRSQVWDFPTPAARRMEYARQFLAKYQGTDHAGKFYKRFKQDIDLIQSHLTPRFSDPGHSTRSAPNNQTASGEQGSSYKHKDRSSNRRNGATGVQGNRSHGSSQAPRHNFCKSRVDRNQVEACRYGQKCKFSHNCASCGRDHAARSCKQWDSRRVFSITGQ